MYGNDTIATQLNAKELILAKINASSKFADIYTYLLSTGESFATIADFMVNPVFNVVAMYADGLVFDPNTKFFDLENALNFVQDIQTLPIVDNKIFNRLLTNTYDNGEPKLLDMLLEQFKIYGKNQRAVEDLKAILGTTSNSITDISGMYERIVRNSKNENTGEYTDQYKAILAFWYKQLRTNPDVVKWLTDAFKIKIKQTEESGYASEGDYEFDDINMEDLQDPDTENDMTRSYDYDKPLTHADWIRYYNYVTNYLVPKNQAIGDKDTGFLTKLRENIVPALEEQRMLAKILGINQGLNTQDFDEYKWIRDIESFINERYINYTKEQISEEFNLIRFLSDKEYQKRHIEYYEKVKSTYNILAVVSNTPHFWEMLKLSGTNRKILLKSVALKYERVIADKLLKMAKPLAGVNHNGLSKGLTQKLNEQEYKILQDGVRDLIIRKWMSTLGDVRLKLPFGKNLKYFHNGNSLDVTRSFKDIGIATADGLATFKWAMENYIIDELKKDPGLKDNEFIKSLLVSYSIDRTTETYNSFITLPVPLTNYDNNPELERKINLYQSAFNSIYRKKVPESLGIGDWTIGDLFYLYNLYVYKDGFGMNAMTRLFDDMIVNDDDSLLINNFYNYIAKLDSGTEVISVISRIDELTDNELQNPKLLTVDEDNPMSLLYDFRLLFKDTPSAGTKFRIKKTETTNHVTGVKQTEYKYLRSDYSEDPTSPKNHINKNYYMFPFSKWNPIVITNPNRVSINEVIEESVNGSAAVEVIVKHLQKSFGTRIRIVTINDAWLDKNSRFKKDGQLVKGFVHNGTIYVNTDHATASTPIHELMHVIFAAIKYGNEEQRQLYYDIIGLVNTKRSDPMWDKYYKQVESEYKDYAIGSDFKEEVVIHVMEDVFTSGYLDALHDIMGTDVDSDFTIENTRSNYNTIIIDAINKVFETKLKEDVEVMDILNKSLGEVVYDLSEGLFNFGESDFAQYYIPINQRIAKFKRIMYKENKLTDNGKC